MLQRAFAFQQHTGTGMHIIIIAWLWVILMMAITERSATAGVLTFLFYGLAPCVLLLWLIVTQRRFKRRKATAVSVREEQVEDGNRENAKPD